MKKALLFGVLMMMSARTMQAEEKNAKIWDPQAHLDFFQPGYNLSGESRKFHLMLGGTHLSLLKAGKFRLPTLGVGWQARHTDIKDMENFDNSCGPEQCFKWQCHWVFTTGVSFVLSEDLDDPANLGLTPEYDLNFVFVWDAVKDLNPRIGNKGFQVGLSYKF